MGAGLHFDSMGKTLFIDLTDGFDIGDDEEINAENITDAWDNALEAVVGCISPAWWGVRPQTQWVDGDRGMIIGSSKLHHVTTLQDDYDRLHITVLVRPDLEYGLDGLASSNLKRSAGRLFRLLALEYPNLRRRACAWTSAPWKAGEAI